MKLVFLLMVELVREWVDQQLFTVKRIFLGLKTEKSSITTTKIVGSTAAGEAIPPHFQFSIMAESKETIQMQTEDIYIWRKWQEELAYHIWCECQRWNGWSRVWKICDKLIDSSVLRFWRRSWTKSYHLGWQWPFLPKCGVIWMDVETPPEFIADKLRLLWKHFGNHRKIFYLQARFAVTAVLPCFTGFYGILPGRTR